VDRPSPLKWPEGTEEEREEALDRSEEALT